MAMRSDRHSRPYKLAGHSHGSPGRIAHGAAVLLCAFFLLGLSALAMDRFAAPPAGAKLIPVSGDRSMQTKRFWALAELESGNNDAAIGPSGEISRYQVLPATWQHYTKGQALDPLNATDSLSVVQAIMSERCAQFQKTNHRPPTDFEFYLLWNCPARVAHPSKLATDRAQRFANLCQRP
jgi:hypothetical protein